MENNQLTDYQRIESVKNYLKIPSWRQFASIIGVNKSTIYNITSGRIATLTAEHKKKIVEAFPDINPVWVLSGNGDMNIHINGDNAVVQSNAAGDNVANLAAENDRLLSLLEKQQSEREKFLEIIATLTAKIKVVD